jgi:hypothetical protein
MNSPRQGHTATLLSNRQVVLAGGSSNDSGASMLNTAEYYNPRSGYFVFALKPELVGCYRKSPGLRIVNLGRV